MSNLMELVDVCTPLEHNNEKVGDALKKAHELASLGLKTIAQDLLTKASLEQKLNKLSQWKYVAITPEKIKSFLKNKAEAYNKEKGSYSNFNSGSIVSSWYGYKNRFGTTNVVFSSGSTFLYSSSDEDSDTKPQPEVFEALTCHASSTKKGTIGKYRWTELPVEQYKTLPPDNVLEAFKIHKNRKAFDYFTIASVEGIHDPLLLGRLKGDERRYYVAQWGDDVKLDDVI